MAEPSAFWDRLSDKYAAQPIADESAYRTKLARTQAHLTPDMDIFEFGCGTGGTAIAHAPFVRPVHAVAFPQSMRDKARVKPEAAGIGNITLARGDITPMTTAPARYDMALGLSILHLVKDRQAVIGKVFDLLR